MVKLGNTIDKLTNKFLKLSKLKKIVFIIIIIIVIAVVKNYLTNTNKNNFILEKVKISSVTEMVSESGNIQSVGKTDVYSPSTGIVESVSVKNGDQIIKGQKLFIVKSTATVQEQQLAHSNYLTAKNSLNTAQALAYSLRSDMYTKWKIFRDFATSSNYETSEGVAREDERLAAEFQSSQDDWLASEKEYKDQETAIAQAQASVNSTWLLYQATQNAEVVAQADGTISNLSIAVGDYIKASSATNSLGIATNTKPALSISNFSKYTISVPLTESDVVKVKEEQSVTIEADALRDVKYKGIVVRVDDIGTDENGIIKYYAYIDIQDPDDKLKFGMTIDVDIVTNKKDNVLTVSNSAIKPYKGGKAVRIVNPKTNEADFLPVQVGIKGDQNTEVISGLTEGQQIITSLTNEQIQRKGLFGF